MEKFVKKIIIFALLFVIAIPLFAESIVLKSGKRIDAKIIERTDNYIKIDLYGVLLTYYLDDIESIDQEKIMSVSGNETKEINQELKDAILTGKNLIDNERYEEALLYFKKAIQLDSNFAIAHACLGYIYAEQGKHEQAIESCEKALQLNPDDLTYTLIGSAYILADQPNKGVDCIKKSIEINPNNADSYAALCNAYMEAGQKQDAIENCQKALSLDASCVLAYIGLGAAYAAQGRLEEAIDNFQKAIQLEPNSSLAYSPLGAIYVKLGRYEEAINYFNRAIQLGSSLAINYHNLGVAYMYLGQYQLSRENLIKAKEMYEQNENSDGYQKAEAYLARLKNIQASGSPSIYRGQRHININNPFSRIGLIIAVLNYIFFCYCLHMIADKLQSSLGYLAYFPILQFILIAELSHMPWFLFFIPILNIVVFIMAWASIAYACNKPYWVGFLVCIPVFNVIPLSYLAFY